MAVKRTTPPKPRRREESTLLAQIRLAIGLRPDVLQARINTGVYAAPANPKQRIRSAPNGYSDLPLVQHRRVLTIQRTETNFSRHEKDVWVYYGQAIYVETKAPKGRLSADQLAFKAAAERVGAIYIVPRTVEDVLDVLGPVPGWAKVGR